MAVHSLSSPVLLDETVPRLHCVQSSTRRIQKIGRSRLGGGHVLGACLSQQWVPNKEAFPLEMVKVGTPYWDQCMP
jgi:hypothetical protein